ncbi:phosphate uptake regulator PhoU [Methanolobus sp. ZRKC2]|uniref:PhoU domain-containing protein n=1 Tax=Methanolobus sp. ZRKC2 TaxID=3125783 RepID=UPI003253EAF7
MSEKRKIQLTGGSTYIVSLPIKWVRENGLSAGDAVTLSARPDRSLTVMAEPGNEEKKQRSKIEFSLTGNTEDDFRLLVSNYLVGYDIIKIISPNGFSADERKFIKEAARKRLIGIEIVEESRTELVLQSLLNYQDISLDKSINSMYRIISSMLEDVLRSLEDQDLELARDVMQRDDDVDRFYLLTVRQLKAAIDDSSLAQKIGVGHSKDCLGFRLVAKSIERVGDHAQRIAKNVIDMDSPLEENDEILRLGKLSLSVFKDSIEAISTSDAVFANNIINASNKISGLAGNLCNKDAGTDNRLGESKRNILESLQRISEYSADIAEIVINMHAKKMKDSCRL